MDDSYFTSSGPRSSVEICFWCNRAFSFLYPHQDTWIIALGTARWVPRSRILVYTQRRLSLAGDHSRVCCLAPRKVSKEDGDSSGPWPGRVSAPVRYQETRGLCVLRACMMQHALRLLGPRACRGCRCAWGCMSCFQRRHRQSGLAAY